MAEFGPRTTPTALAVCAVFLFVGCGDHDSPSRRQQPTQAALRELADLASSVVSADTIPPASMTPAAAERWQVRRRAILDARPGPTIGTLVGTGVDVLGGQLDAALASDGRVYILDGLNSRILVVDSAGAIITAFGTHGDGPYDFRHPAAIAVGDDWLAVAQYGGAKLFRRTAAGHEFRELLRGYSPRSLCFLSDRRVLGTSVDLASATTIREYLREADETPVLTFGRGYTHGGIRAASALARGRMACAADAPRVVYAHTYLPFLEAFSPLGEPLWAALIADFEQGWFVELEGGRRLRFPLPPKEELVGVAGKTGDYFVASYDAWYSTTSLRRRAYLIDASTGKGGLLEEGKHGVIAALGADRYVRVSYEPFPRIQIWYIQHEK